jgi:hypothetical protein
MVSTVLKASKVLTVPKASPELRAQLVSKVTLASKARPDLRVTKV